jgi:polysaccharide export outer membrane protein
MGMLGGDIGASTGRMTYLIDKDGYINFPVLGKVKLLGLSLNEAQQVFKEKLDPKYLKDPIIDIKIENFKITVLGAVNSPGTYSVSGERVTLLEALGMAGDLTIKGVRKNIFVMRDFNGTKTFTRVDLTTKEALNSPVYYLTQNDVVYVEPNKSAMRESNTDQSLGIIISIASLVVATTLTLTR